jgi:hypothetical protein
MSLRGGSSTSSLAVVDIVTMDAGETIAEIERLERMVAMADTRPLCESMARYGELAQPVVSIVAALRRLLPTGAACTPTG